MVMVSEVDLSVSSLDASVRTVIDLVLLGDAVKPSLRRATPGSGASDIAFHCLFLRGVSCVLHSVDVAKVFQSLRRATPGSGASDIAFHCLFLSGVSCVLHSVDVAKVFQSFCYNSV